MTIDSHQHPFWYGRDDAGLVTDMDEQEIDVAWLLSWEVPPEQDNPVFHGILNPKNIRPDGTHAGIVLADLLEARRNFPERFIVGYCPNPLNRNAPALFEAAYNMHRVRVCGEWKYRMLFDDPRCLELFHAAGRLKCPVVLHLDVPYLIDAEGNRVFQREWYGGTVANLERALQACPETIFVGHAPGFWREISGSADADVDVYPKGKVAPGGKVHQLLEHYPSLYADLSAGSAHIALSRDPDHAREFLLRFADRLLFGRDFYGGELHEFLSTLDLPGEALRKIYFENANRLVPVDAARGARAGRAGEAVAQESR